MSGDTASKNERQQELDLQELAARAMLAEQWAYGDIHRKLLGPLRGFFLKRVGADADSAEELARQALAEALHGLRQGKYRPGEAKFLTFVFGAAQDVWFRHVRDKLDRAVRFPALADVGFAKRDEARVSARDSLPPLDQIEAIRDCLRAEDPTLDLTPEERFVVMGRANDETFGTLAMKLRCPVGAVQRWSSSGIEKLRKRMTEKGHR